MWAIMVRDRERERGGQHVKRRERDRLVLLGVVWRRQAVEMEGCGEVEGELWNLRGIECVYKW